VASAPMGRRRHTALVYHGDVDAGGASRRGTDLEYAVLGLTMTAAPFAPLRQRVPSTSAKAVMIPVSIAAIGCLLLGLSGGESLVPSLPRFVWFAAVPAAFAVNLVARKLLGYDVVVDAIGIRESRRGGITIAWTERPECSLSTLRVRKVPTTARAAIASDLTNAAQIQRLAVVTRDGRKIELDLMFGSPLAAAVARFTPVRQ
jgi:hypothetical protein